MPIELYIFALIIIAYGSLITIAIFGFSRLDRTFKVNNIEKSSDFISIVISARNEADQIQQCIQQIDKQEFPKQDFEVIIVDDASDDQTFEIAQQTLEQLNISFKLIRQVTHQGKKQNLALAIAQAKGSVIITSDADVVYRHPKWLFTISNYFNSFSPNMLVMPIDYKTQPGLLPTFQIFENIALTGITSGYTGIQNPFICNGANLAFKKSAFEFVSGYHTHLNLSSGEDVFLMESIKKIDRSLIHYVLSRELIVETIPIKNFKVFVNQRIRWASKTKHNANPLNAFVGFIILTTNLLIPVLVVESIKQSLTTSYLAIFVFTKLIFDFLLLLLAADYLGKRKYMWYFFVFQSVYWIYALIIGFGSLFIKPYWKGKKIN